MNHEAIQEGRGQKPPVAELRSNQPTLTEDEILAQLERRDLLPETIEEVSQNPAARKSRKACVALAVHPRAPRHLALRLIRQFYTFDLMRFTLHPTVAADLKRVAEEQLIARLTSVTLGRTPGVGPPRIAGGRRRTVAR